MSEYIGLDSNNVDKVSLTHKLILGSSNVNEQEYWFVLLWLLHRGGVPPLGRNNYNEMCTKIVNDASMLYVSWRLWTVCVIGHFTNRHPLLTRVGLPCLPVSYTRWIPISVTESPFLPCLVSFWTSVLSRTETGRIIGTNFVPLRYLIPKWKSPDLEDHLDLRVAIYLSFHDKWRDEVVPELVIGGRKYL